MELKFEKYTTQSERFFNILPDDWQEIVRPIWLKEHKNAEILVLVKDEQISAGGIVFKRLTADMDSFKKEAVAFINSDYYYIGYLWVVESSRGKNLGSLWLNSLKEYYPNTNFWLSIEDENLKKFYLKNDFQLIKKSDDEEHAEWLLLFNAHV